MYVYVGREKRERESMLITCGRWVGRSGGGFDGAERDVTRESSSERSRRGVSEREMCFV